MRTDAIKRLRLNWLNRAAGVCLSLALIAPFISSVSADETPVAIGFSELGAWWVLGNNVLPRYPIAQARKVIEGCAAIGFIIEADGTTSSHRAILSHPAKAFSRSAVEAIEQ